MAESRTNPFRFGVLEANHVEDRFSLDLVNNQVWLGFSIEPRHDSAKHYERRLQMVQF